MQGIRYFPNLFFVAVSYAVSRADFSSRVIPSNLEKQVFTPRVTMTLAKIEISMKQEWSHTLDTKARD